MKHLNRCFFYALKLILKKYNLTICRNSYFLYIRIKLITIKTKHYENLKQD